jgi:hypothetical protein
MNKILLTLATVGLLAGCSHSHPDLNGDNSGGPHQRPTASAEDALSSVVMANCKDPDTGLYHIGDLVNETQDVIPLGTATTYYYANGIKAIFTDRDGHAPEWTVICEDGSERTTQVAG